MRVVVDELAVGMSPDTTVDAADEASGMSSDAHADADAAADSNVLEETEGCASHHICVITRNGRPSWTSLLRALSI